MTRQQGDFARHHAQLGPARRARRSGGHYFFRRVTRARQALQYLGQAAVQVQVDLLAIVVIENQDLRVGIRSHEFLQRLRHGMQAAGGHLALAGKGGEGG